MSNKYTKVQVVYKGITDTDDERGVFFNIRDTGPELDTLMLESFRTGWFHVMDTDEKERYINLDSVAEIMFWL